MTKRKISATPSGRHVRPTTHQAASRTPHSIHLHQSYPAQADPRYHHQQGTSVTYPNIPQQYQALVPGPAIYQPFGDYVDPHSHGSVLSPRSAVDFNDYNLSYLPGSTFALEGLRGLSPELYTPTGSAPSTTSQDQAQGLGQATSQYTYPQTSYGQALFRTHDSLQGLGGSPSSIAGPPEIARGVLAPPLGRPVAQLRPSATLPGPWTGYPFRYENPFAAQNDVDNNGGEGLVSSPGSDSTPPRRPGVRKGPLSLEKREKVNETRKNGACLRCSLYKETCDCETPCARCTCRFRTWKLGCVRKWLEERGDHMYPDKLASHLSERNVFDYLQKNVYALKKSSWSSFRLRLSWLTGPDIYIMVNEAEPFGTNLLNHQGFRMSQETMYTAHVNREALTSPPLVPDLSHMSNKVESNTILDQIVGWMDVMLKQTPAEFPWVCFEENSQVWQREVLYAIWEYRRADLVEHKIITNALRLLLLTHCLVHTLVVPNEDVERLFQHLEHPDYHGKKLTTLKTRVSPKAVNKYIKMTAYPYLVQLAARALKDLQGLLLDKSELGHRKDLAFCLGFLVMIVVGQNQNWLHLRGFENRTQGEPGPTPGEAAILIRQMETEVVDHIIGLFEWRFKPSQKGQKLKAGLARQQATDAEAHSLNFRFFGKLNEFMDEYGDGLPIEFQLDNLDNDEFAGLNVERLLAKFYHSVVPGTS